MVSNRNKDQISLICHAVVAHLFAMFCNEKYRGTNFKWENFPEIAQNQCRDQVFIHGIKGKDQEAIYDHAKQTGFEIAKDMIKWSRFVK